VVTAPTVAATEDGKDREGIMEEGLRTKDQLSAEEVLK
jgi:hypothetical protein